MKIELDHDTADGICRAVLVDMAENIITCFKKETAKKIEPYKYEDIRGYMQDLDAINHVIKYLGGEKVPLK